MFLTPDEVLIIALSNDATIVAFDAKTGDMSWKHALIAVGCAIALLAAFIRFSPSLLHPYGPNEVAIWNQILKREELAIQIQLMFGS